MRKILSRATGATLAVAALAAPVPALAQTSHGGMDHTEINHARMDHSKMEHGGDHAEPDHADPDHADPDHADHDHAAVDMPEAERLGAWGLADRPELEAALAAGGEPIVAKVLGAVCDFCATAMNKTFGKRDDVAAVYVDLDAKTLNLVLRPGAAMSDASLRDLVRKSGYRVDGIARGDALVTR